MADCAVFVLWDATRRLAMMENRPDLGPGGDYLVYPGGKLEPGETPLDAAKRECLEEAGVTPTQWVELGGEPMHASYNHYSVDTSDWVTHAFLITAWEGEPRERSSEHVYGPFQWQDPARHSGEADGHTCVRQIAQRIVSIVGQRQTRTMYVVRYPGEPLISYLQAADTPIEAVALAIVQQKAPEREAYNVWDWLANLHPVQHVDVDAFFKQFHREPVT